MRPIQIQVAPQRPKLITNGTVASMLAIPFYNVGLRLSIFRHAEYFGFLDCADSIILKQGFLGLWRGLPFDFVYTVTNKWCTQQHPNKSDLLRCLCAFLLINLNYCRYLSKINFQIPLSKIPQKLATAYTSKNGLIGILGAALICITQLASNKIYGYFSRNYIPNKWLRLLNRISSKIRASLIVFPLFCLGCKMIQKSVDKQTKITQITMAGFGGFILGNIVECCLGYFLNSCF